MAEPTTEQTFAVDIPMADLSKMGVITTPPVVAKEPKEPKVVAKVEKEVSPVVKDTRDEDLRTTRESLATAQADRERLTKELSTEREKLGSAAGYVSDLEKENHKRTAQALYARGEAAYSEQQQYVNAIHAAKMEAAAAREALEAALADDNLDARERAKRIADATERQTLATQDGRQLEFGKSSAEGKLQQAQREFEAHMRTRPTAEPDPVVAKREDPKPAVKEPKVPTAEERFEQYVGQFPKDSQAWLREHPEYVKDERLNKRLQAAALEWDAEGKQLHTSEFIEALDKKFFKKEEAVIEEEDDDTEEVEVEPEPAKPVKTVAKSTPAAPVSRSTSPARGSDKKSMRVSLTNAERESALAIYGPGTKWNMDAEAAMKRYGGRKLQATADGKYEPR